MRSKLDAFYTGDVLEQINIDKASCIVNQNNGKLLSSTNIALGQMMQA